MKIEDCKVELKVITTFGFKARGRIGTVTSIMPCKGLIRVIFPPTKVAVTYHPKWIENASSEPTTTEGEK